MFANKMTSRLGWKPCGDVILTIYQSGPIKSFTVVSIRVENTKWVSGHTAPRLGLKCTMCVEKESVLDLEIWKAHLSH